MCRKWDSSIDSISRADSHHCGGCSTVQNRLFGKRDRARSDNRTERAYKAEIHGSFALLSECAKRCLPCRVFRRALLLEQSTYRGARRLYDCPEPVYASLYGNLLCISIGKDGSKIAEAPVICKPWTDKLSGPLRLSANPATDCSISSPFHILRKWIRECEDQHGPSCSNLRWSNQNPTWLLHILPDNMLRLVPARDMDLVDYVALSYSWGDPSKMHKTSWQEVLDNKSRRWNIDRRQVSFPASELSRTLRHSIRIVKAVGIEYIWIDSVCIPQGSDWNDEASRMHEVYGNAKFTLVAGAVEDATDTLLGHRDAWLYSRLPCSLAGYSIDTLPPRLDEIRRGRGRVPVNSRAWTLQEERLSPRLVYWCGQMVYWSCSRVQQNELGIEPPKQKTADEFPNGPQRFMNLCWHRETDRLVDEWLAVVEDYLQRDLAEMTDRFPGISGLAAQFYQALSPSTRGIKHREEYLAGLWRGSFARQLAWSVERPADPAKSLRSVAPSWSWASLPLCHAGAMAKTFEAVPTFQLQAARVCEDPADALDAVKRGANVKEVKVKGRFRKLICSTSRKVGWDSLSWTGAAGEQYRLPDPSTPVHARNLIDGRILIYEAHTEPVVGQLDYSIPAGKVPTDDIHVPDEDEVELYALEIGLSSMLLLQVVQAEAATYRRAGVCSGYRKGFFEGSAIEWITLI